MRLLKWRVAKGTLPDGYGHKLPEAMVYKLFSPMVNYASGLKLMQRVYLAADFQARTVTDAAKLYTAACLKINLSKGPMYTYAAAAFFCTTAWSFLLITGLFS